MPCANATVGVTFVHGVRSRTRGWRAERPVEPDRANSATERRVLATDEHIAAVFINVGHITVVWTDGTHTLEIRLESTAQTAFDAHRLEHPHR